MKNKQLFIFSALFFTALNAVAGGPELAESFSPVSFEGFYVGAGIGATQSGFKTNSETTIFEQENIKVRKRIFDELLYRYNGNRSNVMGKLFAGYGKVLDSKFYLGGEIYGSLSKYRSNANASHTTFTSPEITLSNNTQTRLNDGEFGIDLRPGFQLTQNTLAYGTLGAAFNRIKLNSNSLFIINNNAPQFANLDYTKNKFKVGFRVGGGLEQMLDNQWAIRADYVFTNYGRLNGSNTKAFDDGGIIANNTSVNVYSNSILFSIVYHLKNFV